uniref:RNA polymerase beta subunit n=1 Tax=Symbiochloris sp. SG-2018 TaxID=2126034 RepID=UPI002114D789|nr:RNA polymerase beta subunit [Symbiochloris sp. SG-2018]UTQ75746.1 RNA polymerase beta subunit [Symbiochloris sp. SG-2018]
MIQNNSNLVPKNFGNSIKTDKIASFKLNQSWSNFTVTRLFSKKKFIYQKTIPYFLNIQQKSFIQFLKKGLIEEMSKRIISPRKDLELVFFAKFFKLAPPDFTAQKSILKSRTFSSKLYIPVQLTNKITGTYKVHWVLISHLPLMTKRGHFIINGSPRVILNQMLRSPGVYFQKKTTVEESEISIYYADLISARGAWLRIEIDENKKMWARMKKIPKIPILVFLQAMGLDFLTVLKTIDFKEFFLQCSHENQFDISTEGYSAASLQNDFDLLKKLIYRKFKSNQTYNLGELGRLRLNQKLGLLIPLSQTTLTAQDVLLITNNLINLYHGIGEIDDIDNLKNRRVKTSGEFLQNQFNLGFLRLEKIVREKLKNSLLSMTTSQLGLKTLVHTKPINGAVREFFASSPLSQFMDQTNPLAEMTHKRRLSSLGPGGVSRDTAGMAIRGIHPTHYGRICPIETPEGKNAGLVNSLTIYSKLNLHGFLETPFLNVNKGKVQTKLGAHFFSAHQEENLCIAPGDLYRTRLGFLPKYPLPNNKFRRSFRNEIQFLGFSPLQMISLATSLIPFLEHNDANRALMGSNMQRQAVPLMCPENPQVSTGLEARVAGDSGRNAQAKTSGRVSYVSGNEIVLYASQNQNLKNKNNKFHQKLHRSSRLHFPSELINKKRKYLNNFSQSLTAASPIQIKLGVRKRRYAHDRVICKNGLNLNSLKNYLFLQEITFDKNKSENLFDVKNNKKSNRLKKLQQYLSLQLNCREYDPFKKNQNRLLSEFFEFRKSQLLEKLKLSNLNQQPSCSDIYSKLFNQKHIIYGKKAEAHFSFFPNIQKKDHEAAVPTAARPKLHLPRRTPKLTNKITSKLEYLDEQKRSQFIPLHPFRYLLHGFLRSNQDTYLTQRPGVEEGDWVQEGDLLTDGSASKSGELSLGKNIMIAYMPWEGYNFEDAILINQRLVDEDIYTSIHIEKYEVTVRETKYGVEQLTNQIPEESNVNHLLPTGLIKLGSYVKEGDILVGKVAPMPPKPLSPHEKLLYDIVGKKISTTRDTSLRAPRGVHGKVIHIEIVNDEKNRIQIYIAEQRRINVGDKMAGRHGNKGIVSNILPRQDMPYLPDGTSIDMVLNPLGVPSRMNVGQIYECLLGLAGRYLNQNFQVRPFDELYGPEASRSVVYSKLYETRLKTGQKWLFDPNFPGKTHLFDGRTGECFDQPVTVGQAYMLKLIHLVDEKIHARSTGPYSLITQQPLRGRSQHGGQRLGEMEVWALQGFGAAYILQELLTVKSDDMRGRHQVMRSILTNDSFILGAPESFKVLIRELQSLCLDIGVYYIDSTGRRRQMEKLFMS